MLRGCCLDCDPGTGSYGKRRPQRLLGQAEARGPSPIRGRIAVSLDHVARRPGSRQVGCLRALLGRFRYGVFGGLLSISSDICSHIFRFGRPIRNCFGNNAYSTGRAFLYGCDMGSGFGVLLFDPIVLFLYGGLAFFLETNNVARPQNLKSTEIKRSIDDNRTSGPFFNYGHELSVQEIASLRSQ
jgi:hypothetical protein